jgi:hypothetical protein
MPMRDEQTCGQGLAQHAELPQLFADLMESVADNLRAHVPGLVPTDANSRHEKRVYEELEVRHREAAAMLRAIGAEMAEQEDMAMGEHDLAVMSSPEVTAALEAMTRIEGKLVAVVQQNLRKHQAMLDAMRG